MWLLCGVALAGSLTISTSGAGGGEAAAISGRVVDKFGENPSCGTTEEDVWSGGGIYPGLLTSGDTVLIASGGDAADTAAGAGCREVTVQGLLASDWTVASEAIATAGTGASSATTSTFIRVFRAWCSATGTYGAANTAAISITTSGGTVVADIPAGFGQTQNTHYTVPAGFSAHFYGGTVVVESTKSVELKLDYRLNADDVTVPYTAKRVAIDYAGLSGVVNLDAANPLVFPAKTDIWITCDASSGTSAVSGRYNLRLVPN